MDWLESCGIRRWRTRELIEDGTIKGEHLSLGKKKKTAQGKGKKKNGKNGEGWEHFRKSQIKEALKL